MRIVSAVEMSAIDKRAQKEFHYPELILMENAGIKLYRFFISSVYQNCNSMGPFVFVTGGGNNGGDALVMAREAFLEGNIDISIIIVKNKLNKIVSTHLDICRTLGINIVYRQDSLNEADNLIKNAGVIFDGITGTGLSGELLSPLNELVTIINRSPAFIVSIDIPSGLGEYFSSSFPAIFADVTLTVGLPKISLYLPFTRRFCGSIHIVPIGFPPEVLKKDKPGGAFLSDSDYLNLLPAVDFDVYKNKRGSVGVFAGSMGTIGAAYLSAEAAARSRTGLVTLFLENDIYDTIACKLGAVMAVKLDKKSDPEQVDYSRFSSILAGPGWGKKDRKKWLEKFISCNIPGVIDADGIAVLSEMGKNGVDLKERWVLTPHPGEFCKLAGISRNELFSNTIPHLIKICKKYNAVVVLKSSVTYIGVPGGDYWIIDGMNPALATGGSGDLLTGIIAGFLSGGTEPSLAARLGVLLHSIVGKAGYKKFGWFLAEDLLPLISSLISGKKGGL